MENKTLKFKTNLNCGGCVSKVQADLDAKAGAGKWHVDIEVADKILTVTSSEITEEEVVEIIQGKGFTAEPMA